MKGSTGNDELEAIQRWVRSLSRNELLSAMEFRFVTGANDTEGSSHEFDLLKEMVQLQSPPATPIHPRALCFKPLTCMGATDGKNEAERVRKNRFRRPRLFQFLEREKSAFDGNSSGGKRRGSRRRQNHRSGRSKRFDVIARNFVTSWGEVLSIGCTAEQQQADNDILRGTCIKYGSASSGAYTYCTFRGCLSAMDTDPSFTNDEEYSLLRMMQIASRGKFLSVPFPPCDTNWTTKHRHSPNSVSLAFCAPWLDPMGQWFSLTMYLASRYEVALWTSFRQQQTRSPECFPPDDALEKLSQEQLSNAIFKATTLTLLTDILPKDSASIQIRDTMLWHLFDGQCHRWLPSKSVPTHAARSINVISLLEVGSKLDQFRALVQKRFQDELAQELQKDLVRSLTEDGDPPAVESPTRKRRSKKKKRNKQRIALPVVHEEKNTNGNCSGESSAVEDLSDDCLENIGRHVGPLVLCPPSPDRNRNTIAVLHIIDEVVDKVFDRVGLNNICDAEEEAFFTRQCANKVPRSNGELVNDKNVIPDSPKREEATSQGQSPNEAPEGMETEPSCSDLPTEPIESKLSHTAGVHNASVPSESHDVLSPDPYDARYGDPNQVGFFGIPSQSEIAFNFSHSFDGWERMRRHQSREKSLFTELFLQTEDSNQNQDDILMASSTAASIASSSGIDEDVSEEGTDSDSAEVSNERTDINGTAIEREAPGGESSMSEETPSFNAVAAEEFCQIALSEGSRDLNASFGGNVTAAEYVISSATTPIAVSRSTSPLRSPSPQAPKTPPPQLSPILVSLADLKTLRRRTPSEEFGKAVSDAAKDQNSSVLVAGSLPSSPIPATSNGLTPSWSREDLRISSFTDDQKTRRKGLSYRNAAAKSLVKPVIRKIDDSSEPERSRRDIFVPELPSDKGRRGNNKEAYAQSENALEGQEASRRWSEHSKAPNTDDNVTTTKDGSTTISSALSPQGSEDVSSLREERNSFRDMCLTLGAEVAMLKNLLAAEKGSKFCFSEQYPLGFQPFYGPPSYNPDCMPPFLHGIPTGITSSRTVAAMSDAGIHRGDHESVNVSEDGTDIVVPHDNPTNPRAVLVHRVSSATMPGSDASMDHTLSIPNEFRPLNRESFGSVPSHGFQSRLTKDIMNYLNGISTQLRRQAGRRRLATERLSRLITALWPRAQVKLYGSHVTGNCLPSSDLDFVICLPAVHKNAPAVAPGILEGRNAINETSQKILARKLKGESWIDPNSIKIIERTVVPIIKLSTKDTRARVLQLDISFDGPEHRGLAAIDLVTKIMAELPMIRPLMLVLKQFLLDRGLLTAFTGGLSSYCLFLMITRYLQEQPSSWGDCGSLLMGFLDFYGNSFDPRATGISVGRGQYFSRMVPTEQPMWNVNHPPHGVPSPGSSLGGSPEFLLRRHSFTEKAANVTPGVPGSVSSHGMRPPRFHPLSTSSPSRRFKPQFSQHTEQGQNVPYDQMSKPYTFDPLFVEDPLSAGNNVGRNAFRIFQIQRAFSDAHRALVASLEWDIYSSADLSDGADYPLLKCLLQSEDVFYELEDPR